MLNAEALRPLYSKEVFLFSRRSSFNRCCNKSKTSPAVCAVLFEKGTRLTKE